VTVTPERDQSPTAAITSCPRCGRPNPLTEPPTVAGAEGRCPRCGMWLVGEPELGGRGAAKRADDQ
jgi:ribosomal protein S27AE